MKDESKDHEEIKPLLSEETRSDFGGRVSHSLSSSGYETIGKSSSTQETKVYWYAHLGQGIQEWTKYRWYILVLFSVSAAMSNIVWNTWGPIETTARVVFGWNAGTVSLLADWGTIIYIIFVFPSSYALDVFGLRKVTLFASLCSTLGTGLRCITLQSTPATYLIHVGHIVVAFGGPVAQAAATALSRTWFPPNQRTTATAVCSIGLHIGLALSFVFGPKLVEDIDNYHMKASNPKYQIIVGKLANQIMRLMYIHFGINCGLLLLVFFTFPDKPPKPPSITAILERVDFKKGLMKLIKNPQFQLIAFAYGLVTGAYGSWCSDLALNLKQFNIDDETSSWIGFWAVIVGGISSITLSLLADRLGALKLLLIMVFIVATAAFLIFSLICVNLIPQSMILFYMTSIVGGLCINGSLPLFFELAVESSYPVAEGINTGAMTFLKNIIGVIFLSLPLIPNVGTSWMNWFLVATCALCIPIMIIFKERYKRLEIDLVESNTKNVNNGKFLKYPDLS